MVKPRIWYNCLTLDNVLLKAMLLWLKAMLSVIKWKSTQLITFHCIRHYLYIVKYFVSALFWFQKCIYPVIENKSNDKEVFQQIDKSMQFVLFEPLLCDLSNYNISKVIIIRYFNQSRFICFQSFAKNK